MPVLSSYVTQTQFLLHDPLAQAYPLASVQSAVNTARSQVAGEGECVRTLLSGGVVINLVLNSGGSGYTGTIGTLVFTGLGNQAFGTAVISGGVVQSLALQSGGWGWMTAPIVTVVDSLGFNGGAVITATVDNSASTVTSQEAVQFSTLNTLAALTPGISEVIAVNTVACQWGTGSVYKPMLRKRSWSWYQANCRVYSVSAMNFPAYWSQYAQGVNGSFYLFPIPGQQMSMDLDTTCLPVPLTSDSTPDAIPYPWSDAVPYFAAYLCFQNSTRIADAGRMFNESPQALGLYQIFMRRARKMSEASAFVPDQYMDQ
jgi:hypothetical protein